MSQRSNKRPVFTIVRRTVQIAVLLLFAVPLVVVGSGLFGVQTGGEVLDYTAATLPFFGSLSSSSIGGVTVLDPFAMLQALAASKTFDPSWLVGVVPVLVVYGLVRGRAFCGWVCPVNLALEGLDWLRNKLGIQVADHALPRHTKLYVAIGVLVASAVSGVLVYELFNPISAINKLILFGSFTGVITLAGIVVAELFWARRVWCRAICPLGGFYEALGTLGFASVKMNYDVCTHCGACSKACICDPEILQPALDGAKQRVVAGDCMLCGKCVDVCPAGALKVGLAAPLPK